MLAAGTLKLTVGATSTEIFTRDETDGLNCRLTYFQISDKTVYSAVTFLQAVREGKLCLHIGYDVDEAFRGGRGKKIVALAITEVQHFMASEGIQEFFIEAFIDKTNIASQHVAEATISPTPISTESDPLVYVRYFGPISQTDLGS